MGGHTPEQVAHAVESPPVESTAKKLSRSHAALKKALCNN